MKQNPFLTMQFQQRQSQPLTPVGSWGQAKHVWDAKELDALALCQASGRPLLIRGESGTGKSQVARAAAALLEWDFLYEVITARHEAQDLLWRYDAVERLAIANTGASSLMQDFVMPGPLWLALNPSGAADQSSRVLKTAQHKAEPAETVPRQPAPDATKAPSRNGTVVLLDEIDKADSDLPNSLLEVLANGSFTLPWGAPLLPQGSVAAPTLVVITSNEERELPAAFVRRCVCLHLVPPPDSERGKFLDWLQVRARAQFAGVPTEVLAQAAGLVHTDRLACPAGLGARPGLAEYLDLLRALDDIAPGDVAQQLAWLARLAPYALLKQYPQDQSRGLNQPDSRDPAQP